MQDVQSILQSAPIPQAIKATAWDEYQAAQNGDDLATRLNKLPIPNNVKADLWDAKQAERAAPATNTLLDSRKAGLISDSQNNRPAFETKPGVKEVLDAPLDFGIGIEKALGIDPMHPIRSTPGAIGHLIHGLARLGGMDGLLGQWDALKGIVQAPVKATHEGGQALREGNLPSAMQAVGSAYATAKPTIDIITGIVKGAIPAERWQEMASTNKAKAIAPSTLQGKADVAQVAEEMSQKGAAKGLRGKTIDSNILADLEKHGSRVGTVEDRLTNTPSVTLKTDKFDILDEIDKAIEKLKIPRTQVTAYPEAVTQLNDVRSIVERMPDIIDFDQLVELRRQLDKRAQDAGAYGVNADTLKADINRGVADIVRGKQNGLDPEMKTANHDYSVSRKAADVVLRRHLGETGKMGTGLPGRGSILDDILATWGGQALGGISGGAVMEALNLARQTRGFANIKSAIQQRIANSIRMAGTPPRAIVPPAAILPVAAGDNQSK